MKHTSKQRLALLTALWALGIIALAQQEPASQTKTVNLDGVVADSVTGAPIPHVHIALEGVNPDSRQRYGAVSQPGGHFSIRAIQPGSYHLALSRRGYSHFADEPSFNSKTLRAEAGKDIKDLVIRLVPDAIIAGRVVDGNNVPREKILVKAISSRQTQSAMTDDRGQFRLAGLAEGRYLVRAEVSDNWSLHEVRTDGTSEVNYGLTYYPSSPIAQTATPVSTRAGQETGGIQVKLVPAPILHVSGTVADVPADAQRVDIRLTSSGGDSSAPAEPGGKFHFWRVLPGRNVLIAQAFIEGRRARSAPVEIDITTSSVEDVHLDLSPQCELSGRVAAEADGPSAAVKPDKLMLSFVPLGSDDLPAGHAEVGFDGEFKVSLFPGRYHVTVAGLAQNSYVKSMQLGEMQYEGSILDLPACPSSSDMTIEVSWHGAELAGTIHDQGNHPVAANVGLFYEDGHEFDWAGIATAGRDGRYNFQGVAPGKYRLVAYGLGSPRSFLLSEALALDQGTMERIEVTEDSRVRQDLTLDSQ